jgi:hypothetical protein
VTNVTSPPLPEPAVREEIIAPILKALGYRSNSDNDIRYELNLRYPRDYLGHKKPDTDPPIRGKADYVCYAGKRVTWVVEAKSSESGITLDELEQAFTYARHPEVRAVYFCLCNGREWRVYATDGSAEAPPLRTIDPRDPKTAARDLESLLGPAALQSRFAAVAADSLPPIGPGLLSFAQITGGFTAYDRCTPDLAPMRGLTLSVTGGAIQRLETGGLSVYWQARGPYAPIQRLLERLGLTRAEAFSPANALSDQAANPTAFEGAMSTVFPAGETMYDLAKHEDVVLPFAMNCRLKYRGTGVLTAGRFRGPFELHVLYEFNDQAGVARSSEFSAFGEFEFQLR